jgi:hypothetical protein
MKEIKIEKGIPMPGKKREKVNISFKKMEIGDSFIIKPEKNERMQQLRVRILTDCRGFIFSCERKWNFATRKISDNELRVWRIEDKP